MPDSTRTAPRCWQINIRVSALRFSGIRGDGQSRWDFWLIKHFFRAEVRNAWNHPKLFTPNTTPTNSAFGTITEQDLPRNWTFSLQSKDRQDPR